MKSFFAYQKLLLPAFFFLFFIACDTKSSSEDEVNSTSDMAAPVKADVIEVLDFHGKHRCESCLAIEANTRKTLETYYAKELKQNKIKFYVIDIEKPENEDLADSYKVFGTALFINVIKGGTQSPIDMTNYAFKTGMEYSVFSVGLREELDKQLAIF